MAKEPYRSHVAIRALRSIFLLLLGFDEGVCVYVRFDALDSIELTP